MPVFRIPKLGYSIVPWRNYASLFPTKDEIGGNPNYGKIPVPDWESIKRFFNPPKKEKELAPPPSRGGPYTIDEMPLIDLQSLFGNVHGYENGSNIWVGKELTDERKLETLLHEYATKLLRQKYPNFDHELQHDEVYALVDRVVQRLARHYKN